MSRIGIALGTLVAAGCLHVPDRTPIEARVVTPRAGERVIVDQVAIVFDASGSIHSRDLFPGAKALARAFARGMPAGSYRVLFLAFGGSRRLALPAEPFRSERVERYASRLESLGDDTRLDRVLVEAAQGLADRRGHLALIVFSDGLPTRLGRPLDPERVVAAARGLVAMRSGTVCIHTVQIGADPGGARLLQRLSELTPCGIAVAAGGIDTPASLHAFQRAVFLGPR